MTLIEVQGRKTDQIVAKDGDGIKRMHALSLMYVLREVDGLQQFRITQPCLERLEVELVADDRAYVTADGVYYDDPSPEARASTLITPGSNERENSW